MTRKDAAVLPRKPKARPVRDWAPHSEIEAAAAEGKDKR
jgi:hypothetical protein